MRIPWIAGTFASALLVAVFTFNDASAWMVANAAGPADEEWSGTVRRWHVNDRGIVSFLLAGMQEEEPFELWFRTPGDQSGSTPFEELVLDVLLGRSLDLWTVTAERNESGTDREHALVVTSVSGRPPSETR